MITIGVVSDTHGDCTSLKALGQRLKGVDQVWHAGDGYEDRYFLEERLGVPVLAVSGNSDLPGLGRNEELIEMDGKRFLLTHGHLYDVKEGLSKLRKRAANYEAQACVFGHTHLPTLTFERGILFFNPGSASLPRKKNPPTYGILRIGAKLEPELCMLEMGTID